MAGKRGTSERFALGLHEGLMFADINASHVPALMEGQTTNTSPSRHQKDNTTMVLATINMLASEGGRGGPRAIFPLLILLLVGLAFVAIRKRRGRHHHHHRSGSALDPLRERFARGEIDRAEFEHRQAVLVGAEVIPPSPSTGGEAPPEPMGGDDPTAAEE